MSGLGSPRRSSITGWITAFHVSSSRSHSDDQLRASIASARMLGDSSNRYSSIGASPRCANPNRLTFGAKVSLRSHPRPSSLPNRYAMSVRSFDSTRGVGETTRRSPAGRRIRATSAKSASISPTTWTAQTATTTSTRERPRSFRQTADPDRDLLVFLRNVPPPCRTECSREAP